MKGRGDHPCTCEKSDFMKRLSRQPRVEVSALAAPQGRETFGPSVGEDACLSLEALAAVMGGQRTASGIRKGSTASPHTA